MFTPVHTTLGALLLFSGSFGLLIYNGRVFGISSILRSCLLRPLSFLSKEKTKTQGDNNDDKDNDEDENFPILAGLASSPILVKLLVPSLLPSYLEAADSLSTGLFATPLISAAAVLGHGLLTGWGTKNDHGCTSGHMLCGISRLSPRSMIATTIFFTTGLLTANLSPILTGHKLIPPCENGRPCYYPVFPTNFESLVMTTTSLAGLFTTFILGAVALNPSLTSRRLFAYLAGLQFGLGLIFSGMADPTKVIRFFAIIGDTERFDPSLALIIVFAIGPSLYGYLTVKPGKPDAEGKVHAPALSKTWRLPKLGVSDIDWRFVVGATVFGLAWGTTGICPGPAILRSVLQPAWGALWMSGYFLGSIIC